MNAFAKWGAVSEKHFWYSGQPGKATRNIVVSTNSVLAFALCANIECKCCLHGLVLIQCILKKSGDKLDWQPGGHISCNFSDATGKWLGNIGMGPWHCHQI
mmetsp:Transcript_98280/g.169345  ORF Transcript_98280/g.169345 Transcript_98280/m.169345 type:complete len:101 (+) Transcript_98280:1662-1964(+)